MNKEIVASFLERGYLVSPDFLEEYEGEFEEMHKNLPKEGPIVLSKDLLKAAKTNISNVEILTLKP